jgi:glutamine---fructose-6-phosphate transaminase (isomerizing)
MCGIFGCIRNNSDIRIDLLILNALNLLKNRGYDSCGIYLYNEETNKYIEKFGIDGEIIKNSDIKDIFELLEYKLKNNTKNNFNLGIGHTRWATHGGKTDYNSHPHISNNNELSIVHNGIISNYNDIKENYLSNYNFNSNTDTEVIINLIQYFQDNTKLEMLEILEKIKDILEGTWACIIHDIKDPNRLYFMKNENPLLIGINNDVTMFTSEPSGFMNKIDKYILLRDKTYGYIENNNKLIVGEFKELDLIKTSDDDFKLSTEFNHWMYKEILDQRNLNILKDPITEKLRYNNNNILFDFEFIKPCKYLYIIACGSSYYAGLIASNYFRYTKAFEFINVYDGGEFTKAHLEAIKNPEEDLLILLLSQSGETRDLNIATTICREFSSNRINKLKPNELLINNDFSSEKMIDKDNLGEIKIIGIINVIGSLISRRTIDNIYINCGRENSVASTKSCTFQIIACLLLAIYKSELNRTLDINLKNKFLTGLNKLETDINLLIQNQHKLKVIANNILNKKKSSMFLLGKDELHGSAMEGALKIKEIAYLHAEGFNITALKHGPYALIEKDTPIIVLYKDRNHFIKSIVEEIKTRGAYVIEFSYDCIENDENSFKLPDNRIFTGVLSVIALQLLSYNLSIQQGINPDRPRNLAKVVTVD